ncbi:unnamed protein product [Linum tenue]|uniref:Uncharacterized protein n=1 Tax=Linum tenue TaxID=586396 RepID=A0AAV0I380_9ROSI|nr:unnamed protein product [Linum tenue]
MNFVNKLGLVLTVVFVISLVFLSLQILYLLWRKRRFQQTAGPAASAEFGSSGGGDHHHHDQASALSPSKELLYFFCWKNYQASRIEPADAAAVSVGVVPAAASAPTEEDEELEEMLKLHQLYGASRALFTIKEETERERKESTDVLTVTAREVVVVIDFDGESDDDDEATLFRTPCGSPPYYTPSPSPPRDQDRQDPEARLITVKIAGR